MPECDFKYFSNASAFILSGRAQWKAYSHFPCIEVYGEPPALCSFSRSSRFVVKPIYVISGDATLRSMYTKYICPCFAFGFAGHASPCGILFERGRATRSPQGEAWCGYLTPLELFFKVKRSREGIPAPLPARGRGSNLNCINVYTAFIVFPSVRFTPDFGRFFRSRGYGLARGSGRAHQKPPSSLTRHTGSPTEGLSDMISCPIRKHTGLRTR